MNRCVAGEEKKNSEVGALLQYEYGFVCSLFLLNIVKFSPDGSQVAYLYK